MDRRFRARHTDATRTMLRHGVWDTEPRRWGRYGRSGPDIGLMRAIDLRGRRHLHGAGWLPPGAITAELGALWPEGMDADVPLWVLPDGRIATPDVTPAGAQADLPARLRHACCTTARGLCRRAACGATGARRASILHSWRHSARRGRALGGARTATCSLSPERTGSPLVGGRSSNHGLPVHGSERGGDPRRRLRRSEAARPPPRKRATDRSARSPGNADHPVGMSVQRTSNASASASRRRCGPPASAAIWEP